MSIIIGGDDDLPDAFNEIPPPLDATDSTVRANAGSAPPRAVKVHPKIRERRIDIARHLGRKRLIALVVGAVVFIGGLITLLVFTSSMFSVDDVQIYGDNYTTPAELQPIIDSLVGEPVLAVDLDLARTRLESLPFVREAQVEADFPHTVRVEIEERLPVIAFPGDDGRFRVIDAEGRVLTVLERQPVEYPTLTNAGPNADAGAQAPTQFTAVALLARSVPAELEVWVSSYRISATGETAMTLRNGTVIAFGQPTQRIQNKLAVVITLLRETPPTEITSIDVTDPDDPVVVGA